MTAEIIKFPGRKRINPNEFRITDDRRSNIRYKQQTLEEIEAEIRRDELDEAIRVILRHEGLIE